MVSEAFLVPVREVGVQRQIATAFETTLHRRLAWISTSIPSDPCLLFRGDFMKAIEEAKEHILAGDIFQIVLSQRFERRTFADPYEIYRALRIVNPSPYMIYLQARGCILVASSPEILCRITGVSISRLASLLCFSLASFTFWCILLVYVLICLGQEGVVPRFWNLRNTRVPLVFNGGSFLVLM